MPQARKLIKRKKKPNTAVKFDAEDRRYLDPELETILVAILEPKSDAEIIMKPNTHAKKKNSNTSKD
jgi:hypothetical protein